MSNVLTGLAPVIYTATDVVAREQVGLQRAVTIDAQMAMAALGQSVRTPISLPTTGNDIAPSNVSPNSGGQTIEYKELQITYSKAANIQWTGEEERFVGPMLNPILASQAQQAIRFHANNIENLVAQGLTAAASRASGTVGATPFATANDLTDFAAQRLILEDNGAPGTSGPGMGLHIALRNKSMFNVRAKQSELFKVNEAGTDELLREGAIQKVLGLYFHQSAGLENASHAASSAASWVTAGAQVVGDGVQFASAYSTPATNPTSNPIVLSGGTGNFTAGDLVYFGSDTSNVYVVQSWDSGNSYLWLNNPGLVAAVAGSTAVHVVSGTYKPNVTFAKEGFRLATRQPIMPAGGDAAVSVMPIVDPVGGLIYQLAEYKQYRQVHIEVGLAAGTLATHPAYIALLLS